MSKCCVCQRKIRETKTRKPELLYVDGVTEKEVWLCGRKECQEAYDE